jgi:hypothetical protein
MKSLIATQIFIAGKWRAKRKGSQVLVQAKIERWHPPPSIQFVFCETGRFLGPIGNEFFIAWLKQLYFVYLFVAWTFSRAIPVGGLLWDQYQNFIRSQ